MVVARYAGSPELPAAVEAAVRAQQANDVAVQYGLAAARILERVVMGHSAAEVRGSCSLWGWPRHAAACCCRRPALAGAVGAGARAPPSAPRRLLRSEPTSAARKRPPHTLIRAAPPQAIDWARTAPEVPEPARGAVSKAAEAAASPAPLNDVVATFGSSCAMPGALQGALVAASRAGGYEAGVRSNMLAGGDNASRACYLGALLGAAAGGPPAAWAAKLTGAAALEAAAGRVAKS